MRKQLYSGVISVSFCSSHQPSVLDPHAETSKIIKCYTHRAGNAEEHPRADRPPNPLPDTHTQLLMEYSLESALHKLLQVVRSNELPSKQSFWKECNYFCKDPLEEVAADVFVLRTQQVLLFLRALKALILAQDGTPNF